MSLARRAGAVGSALVLALAAIALVAAPVAATDVSTAQQLRDAWANPAETLITLTGDIVLDCEGEPTRDSATDILVDGNGFEISQPCAGDDVLHADGTGAVTIRDITLTGSENSDDGIDTDGNLFVEQSTVQSNGSDGVESDSDISVVGSTISGNGNRGVNSEAMATVTGSLVSANDDVGVWSGDDDDAVVTDSTIAQNGGNGVDSGDTASATRSLIVGNGGALITLSARPSTNAEGTILGGQGSGGLAGSHVELTNSTVIANAFYGASAGGSIAVTFSTVSDHPINLLNPSKGQTIHLQGSVVIDPELANCEGPVEDLGDNFVDDGSCGEITPETDDPMLGSLAGNGGPTWTRLPASGSPLINGAAAGRCAGLTIDQRHVARPQGPSCDIGSVEVLAVTSGSQSPIPSGSPSGTPAQLPDTASRDEPFMVPMAGTLALVLVLAFVGLAARWVRQER